MARGATVEAELKCTRCGRDLDEEEAADPRRDEDVDDGILCDECYHEHYEFECCRCGNYDHVKVQHRFLVVFVETNGLFGPVAPGLYRITEFPYYGGPIIGDGWLENHALERAGDIPLRKAWNLETRDFDLIEPVPMDDYPCGHLCGHCQEVLTRRVHNTCVI